MRPCREWQKLHFQRCRLAGFHRRRRNGQLKNAAVTIQLAKLAMRSEIRKFDALRDVFQLVVALAPNVILIEAERETSKHRGR